MPPRPPACRVCYRSPLPETALSRPNDDPDHSPHTMKLRDVIVILMPPCSLYHDASSSVQCLPSRGDDAKILSRAPPNAFGSHVLPSNDAMRQYKRDPALL